MRWPDRFPEATIHTREFSLLAHEMPLTLVMAIHR